MPNITWTRPWLYPKQEEAFFGDERFSITEGATKTGKTTVAMTWLIEQALKTGKPNRHYWWVAPIYRQAKIAYNRFKAGLPPGSFVKNDTDLTLTLPFNGAILEFKGADQPDTLYGEDVFAFVMDEFTRAKEEAWFAIRSTITQTGASGRFIGNVKGRGNWGYKLARMAESKMAETGPKTWRYSKITAYDAAEYGIIPLEEIEDAKSVLPEHVFKELYMCIPADDGGNPFGLDAIADCVGPMSAKEPRFFGVDLGKAVDFSVVIGIDEDNVVCRFERFQKPWKQAIPEIVEIVGTTPTLVDSTGIGDPILEFFQGEAPRTFEGFKYSGVSKQQLMEGLALVIQQRRITFPEGPIRNELETFEYEYTRTGIKYCVDSNTRILTADLRWVPADTLVVGDDLLAFDEFPLPDAKSRSWRRSAVTHADVITRPCWRVILDDGTDVTVSAEHQWLIYTEGHIEWRRTDKLQAPHPTSTSRRFAPTQIVRLLDVWEEAASYSAGYLAAAFDGEGCIRQRERTDHPGFNAQLSFAQLENGMAVQVREYLQEFGFSWSETIGQGKAISFCIRGRRNEFLRFLGQIRPRRLMPKFNPDSLGTLTIYKKPKVAALEFLGERPVVALGTSTATFVAEGLAAHNSAPSGLHDDCVNALALAAWKIVHRPKTHNQNRTAVSEMRDILQTYVPR